MTLDEIRQAISILNEIEGDIPLLEDQDTLHSDKDIELICGSLLTVRKGTLQVIHLTVKEFLMANDAPENTPHAKLSVDPTQASMILLHVCLRCIGISCMRPIVDVKDRIGRVDFQA